MGQRLCGKYSKRTQQFGLADNVMLHPVCELVNNRCYVVTQTSFSAV
jgi:hypothetical protein